MCFMKLQMFKAINFIYFTDDTYNVEQSME